MEWKRGIGKKKLKKEEHVYFEKTFWACFYISFVFYCEYKKVP